MLLYSRELLRQSTAFSPGLGLAGLVERPSCHQPRPWHQAASPLPGAPSLSLCLLLPQDTWGPIDPWAARPDGSEPRSPGSPAWLAPHWPQGRSRGHHRAYTATDTQARTRGPSRPPIPGLLALDLCQPSDRPWAGDSGWGTHSQEAPWKFPWMETASYQCGNEEEVSPHLPFRFFPGNDIYTPLRHKHG